MTIRRRTGYGSVHPVFMETMDTTLLSRLQRLGGSLPMWVVVWTALPLSVSAQEATDSLSFRDSPFLRIDPEKVVLDERDSRVPCGECHVQEYEVWLGTTHAEGFNTLHRTDLAQDILRSMDLRTAKRQESLCMRCHYTVKAPDLTAIAGVSCESCHGAARDWVDVHNQWGPGVEHPDNEDPAHREERIQESETGGMLRPSGDLYAVVANCFECHTVPREELINVGGHPSGSSDFELNERIDEIRHNFVAAQWGGSDENRERSVERERMTYVIGNVLDYEYSIRGMAAATEEGRFAKSMERRVTRAARDVEAIGRVADIPQVKEILATGRDAELVPNNREPLLEVAERIRTLAQGFTSEYDGTELASLDPLVAGMGVVAPATDPPPQQSVPAPATEGPDETPTTATSGGAGTSDAPSGAAGEGAAEEAAGAAEEPAGPSVVGAVHNRPTWFPDPDPAYQTTQEAEECVSCHLPAEEWWYADPHESSALKLANRDPTAVRIASLYGLSADEMTLGSRICMNCHGTIESAAPNVPVFMGVSCESCHGPSSEYLDPHQDGGNPQLGMVGLKDASARAANCSRCHRITDDRLISSGHPTGSDYDIASANESIRHWPDERRVGREREDRGEGPYPEVPGPELQAAFDAVAAQRPIPDVAVATLPEPAPPDPAPAPEARTTDAPPAPTVRERAPVRTTGGQPVSAPPPPPTPRPVPRTPSPTAPPSLELGPRPEVDEAATTEDILLLVKQRLDALYRALGRGN